MKLENTHIFKWQIIISIVLEMETKQDQVGWGLHKLL